MEWLDAVFEGVLRSSCQTAVLIGLVLLLQRLFRRQLAPRWRYALWLLVLVRLTLPISLPSTCSLYNLARALRPPPETLKVATPPAPLEPRSPALSPPVVLETTVRATAMSHEIQDQATPPASAQESQTWNPSWVRMLPSLIWLLATATLAARLLWHHIRISRRLRGEPEAGGLELQRMLRHCEKAFHLRTAVTVLETSMVKSPALFGCWRPRLLLPRGMNERFSPQELHYIFLHELAHLKRRDTLVHWLMTGACLIHWFNPFVWLARRRMNADRELACDAMVLAQAAPLEHQAYGQTIVKLLESFIPPSHAPGMVGILEDKKMIFQRIKLIAGYKKSSRWAVLALPLIVALGLITLTDAQSPKTKPPGETAKMTAEKSLASEDSSYLETKSDTTSAITATGFAPTNSTGPAAIAIEPRTNAISGSVQMPNGQPAVNAEVFLWCGELVDKQIHGQQRAETDSRGFFSFQPTQVRSILIRHPQGCAEVSLADLSSPVVLQPWGRIEGVVYPPTQIAYLESPDSSGKMVRRRMYRENVAQPVELKLEVAQPEMIPQSLLGVRQSTVTTDAQGFFVIPQVWPGEYWLCGRSEPSPPTGPRVGVGYEGPSIGNYDKILGRFRTSDEVRVQWDTALMTYRSDNIFRRPRIPVQVRPGETTRVDSRRLDPGNIGINLPIDTWRDGQGEYRLIVRYKNDGPGGGPGTPITITPSLSRLPGGTNSPDWILVTNRFKPDAK